MKLLKKLKRYSHHFIEKKLHITSKRHLLYMGGIAATFIAVIYMNISGAESYKWTTFIPLTIVYLVDESRRDNSAFNRFLES